MAKHLLIGIVLSFILSGGLIVVVTSQQTHEQNRYFFQGAGIGIGFTSITMLALLIVDKKRE